MQCRVLACLGEEDQSEHPDAGHAAHATEEGGHVVPELLRALSIFMVQHALRHLCAEIDPARACELTHYVVFYSTADRLCRLQLGAEVPAASSRYRPPTVIDMTAYGLSGRRARTQRYGGSPELTQKLQCPPHP